MSATIYDKELVLSDGELLSGFELLPGVTVETEEIPFVSFNPSGSFSLFVGVSGGGVLSVEVLTSVSGASEDYSVGAYYPVIDGLTVGASPRGDGNLNSKVQLSVCKRGKFEFSNAHATESIFITKAVFGWQ